MSHTIARTSVGWNFDNSYARLPDAFYRKLAPTPVRAPKLVVLNERLAAELGLNADLLRGEEGAAVFAGNKLPEGAEPLAQAYAGHQFGYFTMLGDGRALLLGEQITPSGERFDIQLKGSGRTPFSRGGDGRAALGPMLREYIISESMHALGIPTTRSLAVVTTGEDVFREETLPGAVLVRVAASHLRVGTFQYAAARGGGLIRTLADYALKRHFPKGLEEPNPYLYLLHQVVDRQAELIARWLQVGFIHGVMNTDNMSIAGETIDYGPCAFMDVYDPATVFSSIDRQGRYAYGNQPEIGAWNLARFAESILSLLHDDEDEAVGMAEEAIRQFGTLFRKYWLSGFRAKLGLLDEEIEDEALIKDLLALMQQARADFTNTFRLLTLGRPEETAMYGTDQFAEWEKRWLARRSRQGREEEARQLMRRGNPAIIPRNHRVEEALAAAADGDIRVMERLLEALADPYAYRPEQEPYTAPPAPTSIPYRTFCGT